MGLGLLCLVLLLVLIWVGKVFGLWIQALFAGAKVTLELIGMRLQKVDSRQIVLSKIQAVRSPGLDVPTSHLESHYLGPAGTCREWSWW